MKNEYFQENLEKRIKITREMILSKIPNEIFERKSKSQGKWLEFERRKSIKTRGGWHFLMMKIENWELFGFTREMGSQTKHKSCQNHEEIESFSQIKRKYWRKWFKSTR